MNSAHLRAVGCPMRWPVLLLLVLPLLGHAEGLKVSINGTVGGRWLEDAKVSVAHDVATLNGGGLTLGGSIDLMGQISRLRLGGQLGVEAFEHPSGEVDVGRVGPLSQSTRSGDTVSSAMFITVSPFAGLAFGGDTFVGWLDLLISLDVTSARIEGTRMFGVAPVPTLRLGGAIDLGGVGFELSILGAFIGAQRVTFAMGLRL
jgi:hypothetical protein